MEALKFSFAGHQTFPLRQLWPYKAYLLASNPQLTDIEDKIRLLGVGANMVDAIIFWARTCNVLTGDRPTELAQLILDPKTGLDPFCEDPASLYLFHWYASKEPSRLTALWYLFNVFSRTSFTREQLQSDFMDFLAREVEKGTLRKLPSEVTVRRDLDTILRSYAPKYVEKGRLKAQGLTLDVSEEAADALFRELDLIGSAQDLYVFRRHSRRALRPELFAFCYLDFYSANRHSLTLDFTQIAYGRGSPGRVFRLDELSLEEYLVSLEEVTEGILLWSEQTGLRQVICRENDSDRLSELQNRLLRKAYQQERV